MKREREGEIKNGSGRIVLVDSPNFSRDKRRASGVTAEPKLGQNRQKSLADDEMTLGVYHEEGSSILATLRDVTFQYFPAAKQLRILRKFTRVRGFHRRRFLRHGRHSRVKVAGANGNGRGKIVARPRRDQFPRWSRQRRIDASPKNSARRCSGCLPTPGTQEAYAASTLTTMQNRRRPRTA